MMTADQYRASLNDGRETFFGGEQIFDLPGHPILGQTVESAARGYARFYDPAPGAVGCVSPGGAGVPPVRAAVLFFSFSYADSRSTACS